MSPFVPASDPTSSHPDVANHGSLANLCARHLPTANLGRFARVVLERVTRDMDSVRGSVLVCDSTTGRLRIVAVVGLPDDLIGADASRPGSISEYVLREARGVVLQGRVQDARFEGLGERSPDSSLCVPLLGAAGAIGVLNLARPGSAGAFDDRDLDALLASIGPFGASLERLWRLEHGERALADLERLERRRPRPLANALPLDLPPYEVGAAHRPSAARAGDLCARVSHSDGTHTLLVADVSGGGAGAAIAAAYVEGVFRAAAAPQRSAAGIAAQIASAVADRFGAMAVSLWIAQLGRGGSVASCAAGVAPPFLVPSDGGAVIRLQRSAPPAGALDRPTFEEEALRLLPGDTLVVLSDGALNEANAPREPFGEARAAEALDESRSLPLDGLTSAVLEQVRRHAGRTQPTDDHLALAVRYRTGH